jgi:hypothetical protein
MRKISDKLSEAKKQQGTHLWHFMREHDSDDILILDFCSPQLWKNKFHFLLSLRENKINLTWLHSHIFVCYGIGLEQLRERNLICSNRVSLIAIDHLQEECFSKSYVLTKISWETWSTIKNHFEDKNPQNNKEVWLHWFRQEGVK